MTITNTRNKMATIRGWQEDGRVEFYGVHAKRVAWATGWSMTLIHEHVPFLPVMNEQVDELTAKCEHYGYELEIEL